jgi:single-stranded-DNA-specific exonuclease
MTMKDLDSRKESGSFHCLVRPDSAVSFQETCNRIKKAINQKDRIVIYGDYDVDGLTSTAILKLALDRLGANTGYFIPSRYVEGYGLNTERVRQFHEKGYKLIIAVDNGVSAFESVELAKKLGMDVVVIDHHEIPSPHPCFDSLFHQSSFLDYNCSAASLAYFVAWSLLGTDDEYFALLAGIAVFSDVMPLIGNNLQFAKIMLSALNKNQYDNLLLLLKNRPVSYEDVNFELIPSMNAVGRIQLDSLSTNQVCRFLLNTADKSKNITYANFIHQCNEKRKNLVKSVVPVSHLTLKSEHAICMCVECISGLSGLIANKVMRERNLPVAVFCPSEMDKEKLVCSIRVPDGYSLSDFMCHYSNLFLTHGGHEKACGGTVLKKDYFQIATMFASECEKQFLERKPSTEDVIPITLEDINPASYQTYSDFMPFGEGFAKPLFEVSFSRDSLHFSSSGKMAFAENETHSGRVVFFKDFDTLHKLEEDYLIIRGYLSKSSFNGKTTIEVVADKIVLKNS